MVTVMVMVMMMMVMVMVMMMMMLLLLSSPWFSPKHVGLGACLQTSTPRVPWWRVSSTATSITSESLGAGETLAETILTDLMMRSKEYHLEMHLVLSWWSIAISKIGSTSWLCNWGLWYELSRKIPSSSSSTSAAHMAMIFHASGSRAAVKSKLFLCLQQFLSNSTTSDCEIPGGLVTPKQYTDAWYIIHT